MMYFREVADYPTTSTFLKEKATKGMRLKPTSKRNSKRIDNRVFAKKA